MKPAEQWLEEHGKIALDWAASGFNPDRRPTRQQYLEWIRAIQADAIKSQNETNPHN